MTLELLHPNYSLKIACSLYYFEWKPVSTTAKWKRYLRLLILQFWDNPTNFKFGKVKSELWDKCHNDLLHGWNKNRITRRKLFRKCRKIMEFWKKNSQSCNDLFCLFCGGNRLCVVWWFAQILKLWQMGSV